MKKIAIAVAHRFDRESTVVKNSLFSHLCCGPDQGDFDQVLFGDNTGENIFSRSDLFRDLTVQYWLWKNKAADYLGVFQYRKYLSFASETATVDVNGEIEEDYLTASALQKHGLDDQTMTPMIEDYDLLIPCPKKLGARKSVGKHLKKMEAPYSTNNASILLAVLEEKYPSYILAAKQYLDSNEIYQSNVFVMKNGLFQQYNEWLFDILFELESRIDFTHYAYGEFKLFNFFSIQLLGIYITHLRSNEVCKLKELPVVRFEHPEPEQILMPVFSERSVPVVLSSSDYYVPYLATMIQSILDHATDQYNYDLLVFESSITKTNKKIMTKMCAGRENVSLRFYNVNRLMSGINLKAGGHVSVETYYRLLIPEICKNFDKVLYLDSDMTVHADIGELYQIDISGYIVAAAHDQCISAFYNGNDKTFMPYCKDVLKLEDPYSYFQAGVMVLNLDEFRKTYTTQEIVAFATSRQFTYVDQDILNYLCRGRVKHLNLCWNVFPEWGDYKRTFMANYLYQDYCQAYETPKICHHTGPSKPWDNPNEDTTMAVAFWGIARRTPYYEFMLYRMSSAVSHYVTYHAKAPSKVRARLKRNAHSVADKLLPKGTKRRQVVKRIYYRLRGWPVS